MYLNYLFYLIIKIKKFNNILEFKNKIKIYINKIFVIVGAELNLSIIYFYIT